MKPRGSALILIVLLVGCASLHPASRAVKERGRELKAQLDPLLGQSKEAIVLEFGAPKETQKVAGVEVWYYYFDWGKRHQILLDEDLSVGAAIPRRAYDKVELYFQDERFVKWQAQINR